MTNMLNQLTIGEVIKHLVLITGAIIVLLPFYIMVSYSLKSPGEIERGAARRCARRGGLRRVAPQVRPDRAGYTTPTCLEPGPHDLAVAAP